MSVILFHVGIRHISGGYIGVDVFFVISGYLITALIYKEIEEERFTYIVFYKRRAARLLPALSITLLLVLIFGFIFYDNKTFDNLGKELFFSSFGAANILFAQGINYFAKNEAYQPLTHLWSLGVEEQFYLFWPIILLLSYKISSKAVLPTVLTIFSVSLLMSVSAVEEGLTKGYFLLHYRAFELLVGVITALVLNRNKELKFNNKICRILSYIGLSLIIVPMVILEKDSRFPGVNALWPCIGTGLIIAFPSNGIVSKFLSHKFLVFIGLISYPLYLYHQPVISFIYFFEVNLLPISLFLITMLVTVPISWLTYKYFESPIRKQVHSRQGKSSQITLVALVSTIPLFALIGLGIAKTNGLQGRFEYLNPFALKISKAHSATFHDNFERGFKITQGAHGKVLFLGDSVLQQYVFPTALAMNIDIGKIDTVTRGGCVLLKGVKFQDQFADISCNGLREQLYSNIKTYDYVVISQAWDSYSASVLNFHTGLDQYEKWLPFINDTIEHFSQLTDKIIIIGWHPTVNGALKLQPSIRISESKYKDYLNDLHVKNMSELEGSHAVFSLIARKKGVHVIEPYRIFCPSPPKECVTNNGDWSYFSDGKHVSASATTFIAKRIADLMGIENLANAPTRRN